MLFYQKCYLGVNIIIPTPENYTYWYYSLHTHESKITEPTFHFGGEVNKVAKRNKSTIT